jgi:hypothetical protein
MPLELNERDWKDQLREVLPPRAQWERHAYPSKRHNKRAWKETFNRAIGDQSALIRENGANARRPVGSEPLGRQIYLVTPGSLSAARQSTSQNV